MQGSAGGAAEQFISMPLPSAHSSHSHRQPRNDQPLKYSCLSEPKGLHSPSLARRPSRNRHDEHMPVSSSADLSAVDQLSHACASPQPAASGEHDDSRSAAQADETAKWSRTAKAESLLAAPLSAVHCAEDMHLSLTIGEQYHWLTQALSCCVHLHAWAQALSLAEPSLSPSAGCRPLLQ